MSLNNPLSNCRPQSEWIDSGGPKRVKTSRCRARTASSAVAFLKGIASIQREKASRQVRIHCAPVRRPLLRGPTKSMWSR